jgi:acetolactate synthase-1/2/3 large subunit
MQGNDAIAEILKKEGVEYLFSYPNNAIIDSAAKVGIRPIIARSEKTLINMADGYARATNGAKPTVIVVQAGPGIENAFGGMAQAHGDRIPLLMIPGGPDQRRAGGEFDPLPPFSHVTKWTARVNFVDRIPELFRRAFTQLRSSPSGPILVEVPRDVGAAELPKLDYAPGRRYRSAGDPADVSAAARLIAGARRPVVVAGHGALWADATAELRQFAELIAAPVFTTMAGKSAFPETHELSLGAGGNTTTGSAARFLVNADLVVGVGTAFVGKSNFVTPIPPGKRMIQITDNPADVDKDYPIELGVVGDAKLVLAALLDELKGFQARGRRDEVVAEVRASREAFLKEWLPRLTSDGTPINPYRVIWELNQVVDKANTIVTHDSGNPRDQILPFYQATTPRGYLGWGKSTQLGTGYGVAMGAKLAHPNKLSVNVMGDLAFGTAGMEVETAVRERIPIMTVLLNNGVMGGYGHHMPNASERYGSNKLSGSYAKVAEGLGAYSERVEGPGDVRSALERGIRATQEGRPAVLEFITKEEPVYPGSRDLLAKAARELQPA